MTRNDIVKVPLPIQQPKGTVLYVPWGYYYYGFINTTKYCAVYTDAINTCFAVMCHHVPSDKLFFAHVSSENETKTIVNLIKSAQPEVILSSEPNYQVGIWMGLHPSPLTNKNVNSIINAANDVSNFDVYDSKTSNCVYNYTSKEIGFLESTPGNIDRPVSRKDCTSKMGDSGGLRPMSI